MNDANLTVAVAPTAEAQPDPRLVEVLRRVWGYQELLPLQAETMEAILDRRDSLLAHLRERGVGAGVHYPIPVHLQEAYRDPELPEGSLPNTEALSREVISLPLFAELTEIQQEQIAAAVREFFENSP